MAPLASKPGSIGTGSPGPIRGARRYRALVLRPGVGVPTLAVMGIASILFIATPAVAHPWHRHRAEVRETGIADQAPNDTTEIAPFRLTAAKKPAAATTIDIADSFAPFEKRGDIKTRRDDRWFFVESNGVPDHPLMIGIRSWQQQVPLPQKYVGDNAWQIPLHPVPAANPATTKDRFLRGAIAVAVNGIPIFNPLNNRGEDALAIGELDEYGGHCGRADDYHYHVAPVHLEKVVGKGKPVAYALDGYPIYGYTEPDGSPVTNLDSLGGHEDADGHYHYHATKAYPYLNGGFHGEVTEREGQVDPQPRAQGVREALQPLRGAKIVGFDSTAASRKLTYEVAGRTGTVEYTVKDSGAATFTLTDPQGRSTTETYEPRQRGPGGAGGRGQGGPGGPGGGRGPGGRGPAGPEGRPPRRPRPGEDRPPPPPRDGRPPRADETPAPKTAASVAANPKAGGLVVASPAIAADGKLPVEFTCDGAGISPSTLCRVRHNSRPAALPEMPSSQRLEKRRSPRARSPSATNGPRHDRGPRPARARAARVGGADGTSLRRGDPSPGQPRVRPAGRLAFTMLRTSPTP